MYFCRIIVTLIHDNVRKEWKKAHCRDRHLWFVNVSECVCVWMPRRNHDNRERDKKKIDNSQSSCEIRVDSGMAEHVNRIDQCQNENVWWHYWMVQYSMWLSVHVACGCVTYYGEKQCENIESTVEAKHMNAFTMLRCNFMSIVKRGPTFNSKENENIKK